MRTFLICMIAVWLLTIPFAMAQDTEIQPYEVIKEIDSVEVRFYPSATLVTTSGGNNFGKLFQYISGNNESKSEMAFVMPSSVHKKGAPAPKGENVSVEVTPPRYVAAIRYSGYTNSRKEALHKKRLMDVLQQNGIEIMGIVEILGYDSPYKVYNRRNEVLVEIAYAN